MSEPFIAEIRIFAGNFAPRGWSFCDGQLLPIAQNTALFSLIGTTYGGDGRATTGLPNLQGRAPMHRGRGPGLTNRRLGERGGAETVVLTEAQMPNHTHTPNVSLQPADDDDPKSTTVIGSSNSSLLYARKSQAGVSLDGSLHADALPSAGGSQAHNNMQPYLAINYIIALVGTYPSRP
jgi:microcystin-dependent protein